MNRSPMEQELSEDMYMKKLSPDARAKMKANDKMITEVVDHAKKSPEDASRLIRSWLTQDMVEKGVTGQNVDHG